MSSGKYVTNEYKALLNNTAVILSIVLFAIIGINAVLAMIAPSWTIRLFVLVGLIMSMGTARLLYVVIKHFIDYRDQLVIIKWIVAFLCLLIGLLPVMLYIYLNLDWTLLSKYGKTAIGIYWSVENMILPLAFAILVSLIYWTLTIQLYKKSYTTYLCLNKRKRYMRNKFQRFLWTVAGAELDILEKCRTDHKKFAAIGATILMTAFIAFCAGTSAAWYFTQSGDESSGSLGWAMLFGLIWALLIFCIDRSLVITLKKDPSAKKQKFWIPLLSRSALAAS